MRSGVKATAVLLGGVGLGYLVWKRARPKTYSQVPTMQARRLLERAAPLLRLPTAPDRAPEVLADGSGVRCAVTGHVYPYRDGILWLLDAERERTATQQALDTPFTAWAYDYLRPRITWMLGAPDFDLEVAAAQRTLGVRAGDVVLDLACGHGNFTVEWAKRAGDSGLVIGLDYSPAMLVRAAHHVGRCGLESVLLVHGDAHHLPFADGTLGKVNCSGGFHQFPDLPRALHEIARVSAPGAVLATSTFAEGPDDPRAGRKRWFKRRFDLHFVPLVDLGERLGALGYGDYTWSLPGGGWFGYASARRSND